MPKRRFYHEAFCGLVCQRADEKSKGVIRQIKHCLFRHIKIGLL